MSTCQLIVLGVFTVSLLSAFVVWSMCKVGSDYDRAMREDMHHYAKSSVDKANRGLARMGRASLVAGGELRSGPKAPKPRCRWVRGVTHSYWVCHTKQPVGVDCIGLGTTAVEAYDDWRGEYSRLIGQKT